MAEYYTQFATALTLPDEAAGTRALAAALEVVARWRVTNDEAEDAVPCTLLLEGETLFVTHCRTTDNGDPYEAGLAMLAAGRAAGRAGSEGFAYGHHCSKARHDGFSGGGVRVDFDAGTVETHDATEWLTGRAAVKVTIDPAGAPIAATSRGSAAPILAAPTDGEAGRPFACGVGLSGPESDAVLAGLRLLAALEQRKARKKRFPGWLLGKLAWIDEVRTNAGEHEGLGHDAIDALGDRFVGD